MRDRVSTQVLANGAIRYAVYDETGAFLRYEYMLPADEPTEPGTPLNKATLLSDETAAALGLTEESNTSSTVDRAIDTLRSFLFSGKTVFRVHAKLQNGNPAPGMTISGLKSMVDNSAAVTDANGDAVGYSETNPATFGLAASYVDLSAPAVTVTGTPGGITGATLTINFVNFKSFTASTSNVQFSPFCTRVDVSLCGGGGGSGGSGYCTMRNDSFKGGNGGKGGNNGEYGSSGTKGTTQYNDDGSGYARGGDGGKGGRGGVNIVENVTFTANTNYNVTVGSGGSGGTAGGISNAGNGYGGGDSSFLGVSGGSTSSNKIYSSFTELKTVLNGGGTKTGGIDYFYNDNYDNTVVFGETGNPGGSGEVAIRMYH